MTSVVINKEKYPEATHQESTKLFYQKYAISVKIDLVRLWEISAEPGDLCQNIVKGLDKKDYRALVNWTSITVFLLDTTHLNIIYQRAVRFSKKNRTIGKVTITSPGSLDQFDKIISTKDKPGIELAKQYWMKKYDARITIPHPTATGWEGYDAILQLVKANLEEGSSETSFMTGTDYSNWTTKSYPRMIYFNKADIGDPIFLLGSLLMIKRGVKLTLRELIK